jgi:fumarate hydratase, class I
MDAKTLQAQFLELIRRTSCEMPQDMIRAVDKAWRKEKKDTTAKYALSVMRDNIKLADNLSQPLCQDTGTIVCYVDRPKWITEREATRVFCRAVADATKKGYLRQNSVDSITGKNSGNNLGPGSPVMHFHEVTAKAMTVRMMLKGGGSENVSVQYALPDNRLGAGRDLDGVRKCVLDSVHQAQGKGCGPGILGVCVGGDRATGYVSAKEQFFRDLDDDNDDKTLAKLEKSLVKEANSLGIGPMGFGGGTTLFGIKMTARNRVPASFYVTVAYMCWAYRRNGFKLSESGRITGWVYDQEGKR